MIRRLFVVLLVAGAATGAVLADGTEGLGPPSIPIAAGTGTVAAGTGLADGPGTIEFDVPEGATVVQALLYWEGFQKTNIPGDDTIVVDDGLVVQEITGTLIGGPAHFFSGAYASTFRADITGLGIVQPGSNSFTVSGVDDTYVSNGAGMLVIFDDGSTDAEIDLRDGNDLAFRDFSEPRKSTILQTFSFSASDADRTASLDLFFASVSGTMSGGGLRPTSIEIKTSGSGATTTTILSDLLDSVDGQEWDTFTIAVDIPAGDDTLTVQPFSRDDNNSGRLPASFDWLAGAFSIETEEPPQVPGRMTGGGSVFTIDGIRVTRGFEIHCDLREPNNIEVNWAGGNKFHMTELTGAVCTDSPAIDQLPRSAPFDTFEGVGVGLYNRTPGARIEFVFTDAGEPGTEDTARIKVFDPDGVLVLDVPGDPLVPGYLDRGNIQAHKDNKSQL